MGVDTRKAKSSLVTVDGIQYPVEVVEIPFREGVELRCVVEGETVRVSDRGLGEAEAFRILEDEIRALNKKVK